MLLLTIIILILLLIYILKENISIVSLFKTNVKEHFLITVKDRQKIGTNELENGVLPKSSWRLGNMNYETCYSTETRNGNTTGRNNTYYCNQGIDGGEVIPAEGLYSLDFSNYTTHPGKKMRGRPLTGFHQTANGTNYSLNNNGTVNGEILTLAQSKTFCDFLKDKCEGFYMVIPTKDNTQSSKTFFIAKKEEGWEDPDTYSKKEQMDYYNTNIVSYVKKDVNAIEKSIDQDKINKNVDKYKNLATCNWKSANRCIFNSYKYNQSTNQCETNEGLSYDVSRINSYDENSLTQWLNQLYKEDRGVNKLDSEAMNVHNYVDRCKDIDGYEFLNGVNSPIPYVPSTKQGDVRGRYVRISINNRDVYQNWLQLAEVQVISNNRNIAQGKSTSSSGNYPGSSNSKANDGNNDGNWNAGSVYHSGNGTWNNDGGPQFWEVDLGDASQSIDRIIISNRTDCCRERLNNWLLSIHDYNRNLIWARIYSDHPNPKMSIDILMANNDMNNIRIRDFNRNSFNQYFYRISDTEYKSKNGLNCGEQCLKDTCAGEGKKWIGNYLCREYRPGEQAAEAAAAAAQAQNKPKILCGTNHVNDSIWCADQNITSDPSWINVPGGLVHVSVNEDGSLLGTNRGGNIWFKPSFKNDGRSWIQLWGGLKQISHRKAGKVCGVNSGDDIYCADRNIETGQPNWTQLPGKLSYIDVNIDGTLFGVNSAGSIWYKSDSGTYNNWQQLPGWLSKVSVNGNILCGINGNSQIWCADRNITTNPNWFNLPGGLSHIAVNKDGSLYGTNIRQEILYKPNYKDNSGWSILGQGRLSQLSST